MKRYVGFSKIEISNCEGTLEEKVVTVWSVMCFCLKQCLDVMKRFWGLLNMHLNITVEHKTNHDNMCIHLYITSVHQHVTTQSTALTLLTEC